MFNILKNLFHPKSRKINKENYLETISILLSKLLTIYNLSITNNNSNLPSREYKDFRYHNHKITVTISSKTLRKYNIQPYTSILHWEGDQLIEALCIYQCDNHLTQSYESNINQKVRYFNHIPPPLVKKIINYLDSLYIKYI